MKTAVVLIQRDAPNLLEWAQWYARLGFNDIFIGCNRCDVPDIPGEIGSTYIHAFKFDPAPQRLADQFLLYDLVIEQCGADFDWMLFVDDDEYLWLGGPDAKTFFSNRENDYAVAFNWRFFSSKEDNPDGPSDSLLKRFTWRQKGFNKHVKVAAHLSKIKAAGLQDRCFFINPHLLGTLGSQIPTVTPDGERVRGPYFEGPHAEDAWIAHFYSKTKEEFAAKIARGRPDCPRGSTAQYFNCPEHMWAEWDRCNLPEEKDVRLLEFFQKKERA